MSPFSELMTDTVSILKKDGTRIDDVKASVSSTIIEIVPDNLIIESGDIVQHKQANNVIATYQVIDPEFHGEFDGMPAGYVLRVKKLGIPEAEKAISNITYNVHGHNARLDYQSVDNLTNIASVNQKVIEQITSL